MSPTCLNLKELFSDKYRVTSEDGSRIDPWLYQIECLKGHIGVYGGDLLLVCTFTQTYKLANLLLKIPTAVLRQDGDDGQNISVDVRYFDEVARLMQPRRRRLMNPTWLRPYSFGKGGIRLPYPDPERDADDKAA